MKGLVGYSILLFWLLPLQWWCWRTPSSTSFVSVAAHPWGWFGGRSTNYGQPVKLSKKNKRWSSMFTVDPSNILSTLVKAGNVFIPKSTQKDIKVLQACLHCEKAEMNVVQKTMILYNFTIGLKGQPTALRVGRTYIHWDSYTKPTLYVEVNDVDVLVEFHNVLLTKSNWQDLSSHGFPPELSVSSTSPPPSSSPSLSGKTAPQTTISENTDTVKFGSIDLSGKAQVRIVSKALSKELGLLQLDMDSFDDFTELMKKTSESNYEKSGRRGLSSNELATMLQGYFANKIRAFLKDRVGELVTDPEGMRQRVHDGAQNVGRSVWDYASAVGSKTGNELDEAVAARLNKFGVTKDQLGKVRSHLLNVNTTAVREAYERHQQDTAQTAKSTNTNVNNNHQLPPDY